MDISEILDELFRLEYPSLLADHDPDIERYYYLRNTGQSRDAMYLYETRLKLHYPDDEFRTWLMRCYRRRDPAFKSLLAKAYRALGERALERIKRTIIYIAEKVNSYNPKDVYSTIRAAEDILLVLPKDRYEAVGGIERLYRYAQALNLHAKSLARAADLVRSYLTDSLSVVEEEIRRRTDLRQRAEEAERRRLVKADWQSYLWQKRHGGMNPLIDLSAVVFSPADLARIEIPKNLIRVEDQILAYCIKYWNLIEDAAFERILFLYSKKYASKHYDVFLAIRRGRLGKKRDDEILASVMSSLVTGYYYSIQGDRYLQRNWNAVKLSLQRPAPLALPAPARQLQLEAPKKVLGASPAPQKTKIAPSKTKGAAKIAPSRREREKAAEAREIPVKRAPRAPAGNPEVQKPARGTTELREAAPAVRKPEAAMPPVSKTAVPIPKTAPVQARDVPLVQNTAPVREAKARKPAQEAPPEAAPPRKPEEEERTMARRRGPARRFISPKGLGKPGGSVSDRLKELSGRSYDVYQDRFLAKARGAIRKVLSSGRGLFFTLPEEAE
ncbi:MAG: hypothetical protein LBP32_08740, partial [Spirochaetaceae bacterium]|nr:hypothetical protein [Spirochaetaceae bacterium]